MNLFDVRQAAYKRGLLVAFRFLALLCVAISAPLAWGAQAATSISLAISATSVPYQTPIVLTATVTSNNAPVTSGLVLFCDATKPVCENNSALGLAQLTLSGAKATLKLGSGPLGVHQYKAVYRANANYLSSTSNTVSYTVAGTYGSTTSISSTGSVGAYTLSGIVAGVGSVLSGPTGQVTFLDTSAGNNQLGQSTLGSALLSDTFVSAPNSPFAIATSSTTYRSVAIASAYLNGDNNLDVVTGDYSQTISVLLGNGDGSFQPKVNYPGCPAGYAAKIALADFNRDGNTDVALGCAPTSGTTGSLTIILGNGDGTFQAPVSYTAGDVAGIALGDFNNDGIFDIVVSNHAQSNIMVFTGNGDGTFNAGVTVLTVGTELHDVVVGDFNGDGQDDLLAAVNTSVSNSSLSDLYLATGTGATTVGAGSFNTPVKIASQVGEFLAVGDVNGDNLPDVISCTVTGGTTPPTTGKYLWVLINQGTSGGTTTFTSNVYQSDIPSDPSLTDVNGDGNPDIIAGGSYGALVYLGNGNGTFQPYTEPTIGNFALTYAVNAGDFNNDGNADLIGTNAKAPQAAVVLSQVAQSATAAALSNVAVYPLGSGTHQVDASYGGDSIYLPSISSTIPLLAAPTPTTTTLTVSPTSATVSGQSVTLTATVSPYTVGPPTTTSNGDTVKFYYGTTLLGQSTITNGVATLTTTSLPVGLDSLSASFLGDANYSASQSGTMTVTVATIAVSSSANPSTYAQSVTFTASLPNGNPGTVTFYDDTTALGTSNISGGSATYTTSSLAVGQHNITGVYNPNGGGHSSATSPVLVQTVNTATPVVSVATSGASTYGQSVTITATVTGVSGATKPTGTVTISNGTTTIGTGSVNSSGVFTVATSSLPTGTDSISVTYGGDGNYSSATGSVNQTVNKASPTLPAPVVNPSSPVTGSPVTITEQVPSGVGGPVTFMDGSTNLGSGPVNGSGVATITVPSLSGGTHTITASTPGDTNNNPATSPGTTVNVSKITPTVTVAATGPGTYGATETITATVAAGATGTVTFTSGSTALGSGTVNGSGTASITTTTLPIGNDPITASYGGDSSYNSASGSTQVTIAKGASTTAVAVTGAGTYGATETITATVTTGATGTVTFTSGSTQLGSGTVNAGTVSITTTALPIGNDPITASYGGDSNYNSSTGSTSVTIAKGASTTAVAVTGAGTYGATETITATVTTGATGTVTFTSGSTQLGQGTVNAGTVTITTTSLPIGTDTITASYGGDGNYNPSSGSTQVSIAKTVPTVTVTATGPGTYGATETITATVPAGTTGTITFVSGTTQLGSGTVNSSGTVTITTTALPAGTDTVTANYGGDSNNSSASGSTSVTIAKAASATAVVVTGSGNYGATETITATVSPTSATGTVTFTSSSTQLGSGTVNASGIASITTTSLPIGNDPITASYSGDSNYSSSTGSTSVNIAKSASTTTVAVSGAGTYGATETITATVTSGATGTVTFTSGTTALGQGTVNAGTVSITTTALPVGNDPITASYGGDNNYNPSTGTTSVTIGKVTPVLPPPGISPTSPVAGSPVTITETVPPGVGGPVTFTDGTTVLGSAPVNGGTATITVPSLPLGQNTITASTPGDTNNNPATSPGTTVDVEKNASTVTVTASGPATYGSTETITAAVTTGATGTVTFTSGGSTLGSGTVNTTTGTVSITTTKLPVGNNPITANYSGDSNYSSGSGSTSVVIAQITPTVTVTVSGPGSYGSTETITATVPPGATGTITFTSGGTTIGQGVINPSTGTVTVTTATLPVGTDTITANYGGDTNNAPATGSTTVTISKVTPPVTLTSSSNPSTATQPVTFTATVPTTATGTITFSDGSTVIGTAPITNGVATITTSTLPSGSQTITASYSGDANDNPNTSQALTQTVNKNSPVLPPPNVSSTNTDAISPVTITEQVPPGVSGPVTFYDNGTPIGTAPINNGTATITVPSLPVGTDQITASTPGDSNNNPATSPATTVTVGKVTPVLPPPSVSNTNPILGTTVTITETVPSGVTGTVTFSNGGTVIGTAPINNGVATITTSTLPLGNDPITASTQSNATYNSATSPATNVNVSKGQGSVTLTSSVNPAALNQAVTFTATVNQGATGSVTFLDGGTALGVGVINSAGIATFTTSSLSGGSHTITASFAGDTSFSAATSAPLTEVVNKTPTTIVVTESAPMQLLNTSVTFTANVTSANPTPTGTVTFFSDGTAIGTAPMSTNGAVVSLALSGAATYATSALTTGTHQITATYSGDTGFMTSTSLPVTNIVADFTNTTKGVTTQRVMPGDTTTFTFVLTPVGSSTFLSDTTLTIAGLPQGTTYTFSPAVITAGSGATTVTLSLTTSNSLHAANHAPGANGSSHDSVPVSLAVLGLFGLGAIRKYRKQMPRLMLAVLLVLSSLLPLAAMSGCAGGYFGFDPTNYNIQVTGTEGQIQHTATTTLVVQ